MTASTRSSDATDIPVGSGPWPRLAMRRARCTPLPSRFRHAVHAYYDVPAFDPSGKRLVYTAFDDLSEPWIVVRDLAGDAECTIAPAGGANYHVGAGAFWVLEGRRVLYEARDAEGRVGPALVHPSATPDRPGSPEFIEGISGMSVRRPVDAAGRWVTVYGAPTDSEVGPSIMLLDLAERRVEPVIDLDPVRAALPADERPSRSECFLNHPVMTPDGERMFFKLMRRRDGTSQFVRFFVYHRGEDRLQPIPDGITGHPSWFADGRHILNVKRPTPEDGSDNFHLIRIDSVTGEYDRLVDTPIEGPGHPTPSPCGRFVVTDAFTADGTRAMVYLIDLRRGAARELIRLDHAFCGGRGAGNAPMTDITRGQPHPLWSPRGTKILINFNHAGTYSGLYLLEDFLEPASDARTD